MSLLRDEAWKYCEQKFFLVSKSTYLSVFKSRKNFFELHPWGTYFENLRIGILSFFGLLEKTRKIQNLDQKWKFERNAITPYYFNENMEFFPHYGGSTETFLTKCKMAHSKRIFQIITGKKNKKILSLDDINNGFELYKDSLNLDSDETPPEGMYS